MLPGIQELAEMTRPPPAKKPRITPRKDAVKRATNEDVSSASQSDKEPVIIEERHTPRQQARFDPRTLSMEEQVKIYRTWRKNGSMHEDTCFVCRKGSGLANCNTCRLAYHKACLAADARTYEDQDRWYCPICVSRNWHIIPPSTLASPSITPVAASTSASAVNRGPIPRPLSAYAEARTPSRPSTLMPALSALPTSAALPSSPSRSGAQTLGQVTTQPRKGGRSRYSTLRPDVESAISTIYGELELSRSLGGDVERLRGELEAARREIEVLRKELTVTRREAEMARFSAEAYDQLWQENEMYKKRDQGPNSLQEKVEELTSDLNAAREAISTKDAMLDEWKTKLKGLLGEGT
ncbi:hypothetical protein EDD36DRAFT_1256 [Exophiala viscosa]|uniref:PHD-type domain-containing protein n=1 Tax=Exophiala viscosa TaxID=2486360 RepID=A0AAN6E5A9_9EURO|nr:hypothetical protein EDD36DRAFT_1256 [Exophiala viscosa]